MSIISNIPSTIIKPLPDNIRAIERWVTYSETILKGDSVVVFEDGTCVSNGSLEYLLSSEKRPIMVGFASDHGFKGESHKIYCLFYDELDSEWQQGYFYEQGPAERVSIFLPAGRYLLTCKGAKGGWNTESIKNGVEPQDSSYGGQGGMSRGVLTLRDESTPMYLYTGGNGNDGGFNGGGARMSPRQNRMGGGATDIRINVDSLYARVIVAGGGGSDGQQRHNQALDSKGGAGGGEEGVSTSSSSTGGTQDSGGIGTFSYSYTLGTFGVGGRGYEQGSSSISGYYGGSGGGGWFGGGGFYSSNFGNVGRGGGGGSGYVLTEESFKPDGYLLDEKYYLENTEMITGGSEGGYLSIRVLERF